MYSTENLNLIFIVYKIFKYILKFTLYSIRLYIKTYNDFNFTG